jgi:hypothetical protein
MRCAEVWQLAVIAGAFGALAFLAGYAVRR